MIFLLTKLCHSNKRFNQINTLLCPHFALIANQSLQAPIKYMVNKYLGTVSLKGKVFLASFGPLLYSSLLTPSCLL